MENMMEAAEYDTAVSRFILFECGLDLFIQPLQPVEGILRS